MPLRITPDCINCAACADVCPNGGIRKTRTAYAIDQAMCCECVGFFGEPRCVTICPVDCVVPNPRLVLTEEALLERAKLVHQGSDRELLLTPETSHFRASAQAKAEAPAAGWWARLLRRGREKKAGNE